MTMDTEALSHTLARALDRIETALTRVEDAATDSAHLRDRHSRLRDSVQGSLRDLEALMTARKD